MIKSKYAQKCSDEEVENVIRQIIQQEIAPEAIKTYKKAKPDRLKKAFKVENNVMASQNGIDKIEELPLTSEN